MSEHEKSTRKKSMGAEKFHAFMKISWQLQEQDSRLL